MRQGLSRRTSALIAALMIAAVAATIIITPTPCSAGSFIAPQQVTNMPAPDGASVDEIQQAVDYDGFSHIVWTGGSDYYQVWYANNTSGAWSVTQLTSTDTDKYDPGIVVDSAGSSHLVWEGEDSSGVYQIYYATNASGEWVTNQVTSCDQGQGTPSLAIDRGDNLHMAWKGPTDPVTGGPTQVWYTQDPSGAHNERATDSGENVWSYSLTLDSGGDAHLAWCNATSHQVFTTDNTTGSWVTSQVTSNPYNYRPLIAVDALGFSHVTWFIMNPSDYAMNVWYADNVGGSWAPTQLTFSTSHEDNFTPNRIALDNNGVCYIAVNESRPTVYGSPGWLFYNGSGSWTSTLLTNNGSIKSMELGPDGYPQMVWDQGLGGGEEQVWYGRKTAEGITTIQITSSDFRQYMSTLAVDRFGEPLIAWDGHVAEYTDQVWFTTMPFNPQVTGLDPSTGVNDQSAAPVTVEGDVLKSGATLTLTGPDTIGPVPTTGSGNALDATLDLRGKAAGIYNATVTNPDGLSGTKTGAFTVNLRAYTVNATVSGGHGTATPATQTVNQGGSATVNLTPDQNYRTASVTDNGSPVTTVPTTSYTISNVTADHDVVVTFAHAEPTTSSTWYLAEGTNAWCFSTYITIENPNNSAVTARLTYMDPNPQSGAGVVGTRDVTLPPLSQTTVSSQPDIGNVDFSTMVECLQGKQIAVDRTMFWTGEGAPSPEGHSSIGTTTPSKTWYLPEGSSAWGFETWTLVQNPNEADAHVKLTYMTEGGAPQVFDRTVPAHCRASFNMASDIGAADASTRVTSDVPVVAERSMYRNNRREGSCSIGATTPAADFFLAEGATGYDVGFTTYVLVQNPNDSEAEVTLTYMTPEGAKPQAPFTMPANSRKTVRVNDQLPEGTNVSTTVHGSKPVIAERAMYWGEDTPLGEAMHASVGLDSPHMSFYLPDGQTSEGRETWTLVQNPNPASVTVRVTYLPQGGGTPVSFTDEIGANTRSTYNMADKGISGRASIMVQSLDGARPVMVERAMYWNSRGAGTDTVGGYED